MDIQEAKKIIEKGIKPEYERLRQYDGYRYTGGWLEAIQTILSELEKKDKEIEKLSKLLYLCTPEIPQCQHGKYISYVDLVKKLEKKDKIINAMANEIYITAIRDDGTHFSTKQEVIDYFTNKVEEDIKE